jgi:hypothetical protein
MDDIITAVEGQCATVTIILNGLAMGPGALDPDVAARAIREGDSQRRLLRGARRLRREAPAKVPRKIEAAYSGGP